MNLIPWKRGELETNGPSRMPVPQLRWDMDRMFDRFFDDFWSRGSNGEFSGVRLDVHETDEEILVRAEVPGIDPKDIDVQLTGDTLTLAGEKKDESESKSGSSRYSERRFGSFRRAIQLPCPVDPDRVEAEHRNGVVTITLRKNEAMRPKRIAVKTG